MFNDTSFRLYGQPILDYILCARLVTRVFLDYMESQFCIFVFYFVCATDYQVFFWITSRANFGLSFVRATDKWSAVLTIASCLVSILSNPASACSAWARHTEVRPNDISHIFLRGS